MIKIDLHKNMVKKNAIPFLLILIIIGGTGLVLAVKNGKKNANNPVNKNRASPTVAPATTSISTPTPSQPEVSDQDLDKQLQDLDADSSTIDQSLNDKMNDLSE